MSVRYRPDRDKYEAAVVIRGKRRRPLFNTKKEADEFYRKHRAGKFGLVEHAHSISIADACAAYFESESSDKSKKSRDNDKRYLNFHFHFLTTERELECLGEVQLEDLQAFQKWIAKAHKFGDEEKEAWAAPTVARCCKMLKHMYNKNAMTKKIKDNPALYWQIPAGESALRRPMTLDEFDLIYSKCADWFKPVLRFIRLTGARGSSVSSFTFADFDLFKRQLVLKTRKGARHTLRSITLPIVDEVFEVLIAQRNARPFAKPGDPVFVTLNGERISPGWISSYGSRLIEKCGLEGVVLYGLRHALAVDMTEAGVSLEITRQAMGHTSVKTTQRYAQGVGMSSIAEGIEKVRKVTSVPPDATSGATGTALGGK